MCARVHVNGEKESKESAIRQECCAQDGGLSWLSCRDLKNQIYSKMKNNLEGKS